jgi:hypothetical protein
MPKYIKHGNDKCLKCFKNSCKEWRKSQEKEPFTKKEIFNGQSALSQY